MPPDILITSLVVRSHQRGAMADALPTWPALAPGPGAALGTREPRLGPQGVAPPSAHSPVVGQARGRAAEASRGEDGRRTARAGDGFFMGADGGEEVHLL